MIKKIVIDGNDGTGKTTFINHLKKVMPGIEFQDRGIFSETTLKDKLFNATEENKYEVFNELKEFQESIKKQNDTLFIILDADVEVCQKRILKRGDSIEEEFHTLEDLNKYKHRFNVLTEICKNVSNLMFIDNSQQ
jgi:deoxyadenosine/deoxycytidine kinase